MLSKWSAWLCLVASLFWVSVWMKSGVYEGPKSTPPQTEPTEAAWVRADDAD